MYLFYFFILCDTSLILANHVHYYSYDVPGSSVWESNPGTLQFEPLRLRKRNVDASYSESNSSIAVQNHTDSAASSATKNASISLLPTMASPATNSSSSKSRTSTSAPILPVYPPKKPIIASPNGQYSFTASTENSATNEASKPKSSIPLNDATFVSQDGYPDEITSDVLKKHNITNKTEDSHTYYTSWRSTDPAVGMHYWVNMTDRADAVIHPTLSNSHRRAVTVALPFKFLFYGQEIENVTIATGGFLYTGDYVHSWLAATQYIAPLMANFDTSLSNDSYIKYVHNATTFTVLWENVSLQDRPDAGNFTFEVTLCKNGDIIFVYQSIPNITSEITEEHHPVKVGLSDAYIFDRTIFFVRRKTIFEYHRVHFDKKDLKNWTVIYLRPVPTCQSKTSCESCVSKDSAAFECQWCDGRCSNGVDRKRQEWMKRECEKKKIKDSKQCDSSHENIPTPTAHKGENLNESTALAKNVSKSGGSSTSVIFLLVITIACISAVFVWTMYAYRNPHSTSGQILIRYRPSRWSGWRKGEARYTAATIHM